MRKQFEQERKARLEVVKLKPEDKRWAQQHSLSGDRGLFQGANDVTVSRCHGHGVAVSQSHRVTVSPCHRVFGNRGPWALPMGTRATARLPTRDPPAARNVGV